jgi:hypothetical protein
MLVQHIKGMKAVPEYRKLDDRVTEYTTYNAVKALNTFKVAIGRTGIWGRGVRGNA